MDIDESWYEGPLPEVQKLNLTVLLALELIMVHDVQDNTQLSINHDYLIIA
jgi:hypothetical protein